MNTDRVRQELISAASDLAESARATSTATEGLSRIIRILEVDNKELAKQLTDTQAELARCQLELVNSGIREERMDDTIVDLITPLRSR
jgi:hypothetical protein